MRDNIIKILIIIFLMLTINVKADDNLETVEIGQKYYEKLLESWNSIFPDKNRNAAGPKFFNFALKQSLAIDDFIEYNKLYCAVSGSLIDPNNKPEFVYLKNAENDEKICGFYHKCCYPCSCDLMKYSKVKKMKYSFTDGEKEFFVLTIKNPCGKEDFPKEVNKDYFCNGNKLDDNQVFVLDKRLVIGLFHNAIKCNSQSIAAIDNHQITGS